MARRAMILMTGIAIAAGACTAILGDDFVVVSDDVGGAGSGTSTGTGASAAAGPGGSAGAGGVGGGALASLRQLALGPSHSCAIRGGALRCWGENNDGQLGYGHTNSIQERTSHTSHPTPFTGA